MNYAQIMAENREKLGIRMHDNETKYTYMYICMYVCMYMYAHVFATCVSHIRKFFFLSALHVHISKPWLVCMCVCVCLPHFLLRLYFI